MKNFTKIAVSVFFAIVSLGCKSTPETVNPSNNRDGLCVTGGFKLCEYVDSYSRVTVGQQRCLADGVTISGCEPIGLSNIDGSDCSYGALYACICEDGNSGQQTCLYGTGTEFSECICPTLQGAGGGSNTSTTTDTGAGGSAPTTTSTTTETNSGTGGGDAGQGGGGVQPEPESCFLKSSFDLPNDAIPNNNQWIGPFCCTGETVVVQRAIDHVVLGYAYFYTWSGNAFMCEEGSFAPDMIIKVSSTATPFPETNNAAEQVVDEMHFAEGEVVVGAEKSVTVGGLVYIAKINNANMKDWDGPPMFNMQTIKVQLDVELAPGTSC